MPSLIEDAAPQPNGTLRRQQRIDTPASAGCEEKIRLDVTNVFDAPNDPNAFGHEDLNALIPEVIKAHQRLKQNQGDVYDKDICMLGWQSLPDRITQEHIDRVTEVAAAFSEKIDAYVSLGIGGSYLGIAATVSALTHRYFNQLSRDERGGAPEVYYLGQNVDPDYFRDTLDMLRNKRVGINVISKSGTTTETAIAFRIMRNLLEQAHGNDAANLILATTDENRGALRQLVTEKGYQSFVIPDDIGGRFSVLSDVGLVGIAMAGIDLNEFVNGFRAMKARTDTDEFWQNPALVHAAVRTLAWRHNKKIEVVATNTVAFTEVARFMEQLFPESEGQNGNGLWVAPSLYSEKLHANGQMVQDGERNILETFLRLEQFDSNVAIPTDGDDLDGLNYLSDTQRDLGDVNGLVIDGPAYAHYEGGVPNMTLLIPRRSAHCIGQLFYMLERSVAVSGSLLGHNPFVQPGVEAYKKAMFALAGKPGYEAAGKSLQEKLNKRDRIIVD